MTHSKYCIRLGWPGVESCDVCEAIHAAVAEQKGLDVKIAIESDATCCNCYDNHVGIEIAAAIRKQQP